VMRTAARETYRRLYTADENYRQLMHLYDVAIGKRREGTDSHPMRSPIASGLKH